MKTMRMTMGALAVALALCSAAAPAAAGTRVVGGESFGVPLWISVDLGMTVTAARTNGLDGIKASAELGIGGAKGFLGFYTLDHFRYSSVSFAVGAAWLRTFGSPLWADPWTSHLGVEAQLSVIAFMPVVLRLGLYSRVDHFHPQLTAGFGFGL